MQESSLLSSLLPIVGLFAIFYFLLIRPQNKAAKKHKEMIASLEKGDKIVTNGGLIVEVVKTEEEFITIKLNDGVTARLDRNFIARKVEPLAVKDEKSESK